MGCDDNYSTTGYRWSAFAWPHLDSGRQPGSRTQGHRWNPARWSRPPYRCPFRRGLERRPVEQGYSVLGGIGRVMHATSKRRIAYLRRGSRALDPGDNARSREYGAAGTKRRDTGIGRLRLATSIFGPGDSPEYGSWLGSLIRGSYLRPTSAKGRLRQPDRPLVGSPTSSVHRRMGPSSRTPRARWRPPTSSCDRPHGSGHLWGPSASFWDRRREPPSYT